MASVDPQGSVAHLTCAFGSVEDLGTRVCQPKLHSKTPQGSRGAHAPMNSVAFVWLFEAHYVVFGCRPSRTE